MKIIRKIILPFLVFALVTGIFVLCMNSIQKKINGIKVSEKLTDTDPVENAPPIVAFTTVALGSFRGLVADLLWLRAISLQDKGQYFEMVQLASWITKLQPRFTGATAYLAWNMAYNISVTFSSAEDRWRWIKRGIELIRDEALVYNPSDPVLYKELGWIYQHKIGNIMDDANLYYKNQIAVELMDVFGGPEPDWKVLAAAPDNEDQFRKRCPEKDPVWKALKDSEYNSLDMLEKEFRTNRKLPDKFTVLLKDADEVKLIENYFRKRWLKQKYKLDSAKILEINNKYGKLDWRLPEAHAIYWATLGLDHQKSGEPDISCDRMITQALVDAFKGGRLLMFDKNNFKSFMTAPNLDVADALKRTFQEVYDRQKSKSFLSGFENFMTEAVLTFYNYGNYTKAKKYLEDQRKMFPHNPRYRVDVDDFVIREWLEVAKDGTMKQVMSIIDGLLFKSIYFLAYGDTDAAAAHEKLAQGVYLHYKQSQNESWGRTGLPPYMEIKQRIVDNCLANFPEPVSASLRSALEEQKTLKKEDQPLPKDK